MELKPGRGALYISLSSYELSLVLQFPEPHRAPTLYTVRLFQIHKNTVNHKPTNIIAPDVIEWNICIFPTEHVDHTGLETGCMLAARSREDQWFVGLTTWWSVNWASSYCHYHSTQLVNFTLQYNMHNMSTGKPFCFFFYDKRHCNGLYYSSYQASGTFGTTWLQNFICLLFMDIKELATLQT